MIRIRVFGGCSVDRDGIPVDEISGQRKALALLALLAFFGERGISRDTVVGYLWPESDEERARTSLRQVLHSLRNGLESPSLLLPTQPLRLDPSAVSSDLEDFRKAIAGGDFRTATALYAGPFLDGLYLSGAAEFERWVSGERTSLADAAATAMESLAALEIRSGNPRAAVEIWRRLTKLDPFSARAAAGLMNALESTGERAAALQHARDYEARVREDFGTVDPRVSQLAAELRERLPPVFPAPDPIGPDLGSRNSDPAPGDPATIRNTVVPGPAESRPERTRSVRTWVGIGISALILVSFGLMWLSWRRPVGAGDQQAVLASTSPSLATIAVLPFAGGNTDTADAALSDGLTEDLIGSLAKIPGIRVTSRTSAFAFRNRPVDLGTVFQELNVGSVLEGSVRRSGNRVRVNVQLVGRDGSVLWAEAYDREMADLFALQDDISSAIVSALRVRVTDPRHPRSLERRIASPRAYEAYLRGRQIFSMRLDRDGTMQAMRYFREAVSYDSTFAPAHAGLSDVFTRLAVFGFEPAGPAFSRAEAAARKALSIDSTLSEAHTALAHAACAGRFDWRSAERSFRRAVELNPSYTFARLPFAICLASEGRFREAITQLDSARLFDPLAPNVSNVRGRVLVMVREPDKAIVSLKQALEMNPQMDLAYQQLGHAYLQKGMRNEAIEAFRQAAELSGTRDSAHLAYAYAVTGEEAEANRILQRVIDSAQDDRLAYHIAMIYAGMNRDDEAFTWLERGRLAASSFMIGVKSDPAFAGMHDDPRWSRLLKKMSLVED